MARTFPPPRRALTTPIATLPEPPMPTAAQFAMITNNLGIAPSHIRPSGRFADDIYYRGDIDQMIDAMSSPADSVACQDHGLTPSEWHNALSGVLAHAAWRHKCRLPLSEQEIEIMVEPAAPALRDRLRVMLRDGMHLIPALDACESDDKAVA